MPKKLDPKETVSFEELLMSNIVEQKALVNLLEKKGIIIKDELLEEIKRLKGKDFPSRAMAITLYPIHADLTS